MFNSKALIFILQAGIASLSLTRASPTLLHYGRAVKELNREAFEEAHKRDASATRAFSNVQIKTSDGQCLFIDQLSGDFRANLTPVQVAQCDGSAGQSWDIISSGLHNNAPGKVLVVNTLTQGCLDLNKGRVGREVTTFSCGGRADGGGQVSRDQLFAVSVAPFSLTTDAAAGTCLSVSGSQILPAACNVGSASQTFTIGGTGIQNPGNGAPVSSSPTAAQPTPIVVDSPSTGGSCGGTTIATTIQSSTASPITSSPAASTSPATPSPSSAAPANPGQTSPPNAAPISSNPTTPVPVSRAGGTLNPSLAAEAHTFDPSATRARTAVSLRSQDTNECLTIDPTAGDFRQNLIPITFSACSGAENQKFDIVTSGLHNNKGNQGKALVVSSLMNGCVNFDTRRAVGDKVMVFSCGGRAAGEGGTTDDQLFDFAGGNEITLAQTKREGNADVTTCLVPLNGELEDSKQCGGTAGVYSII